MIIYVDLDGVIWNSHEIMVEIYNKKYNKNITINEIINWNFFSKKIFKKIYTETCKKISNYQVLDIFSHYYMFLFNDKYIVNILTHHWNGIKKIEKCLLGLNMKKGLEYNKIIKPKKNKSKINYMKNHSIIIDDNPILVDKIKNHDHKYLLLYDSPWNKSVNCDEYRNVFRVHNFREVAEKIEQLEKI